ncbi:membrane-flanked domain protein [Kribbella flavida DSM 17836]|uniref:Membrane-flanked domain protein n=1 Tax=Kribbella flavida (strain DSM 17836 / JCM 10339 / NBRC 14399) TaxID=479435 RepID=D2PY80_KRIFD|nr:membrane-flanked domain protein [Kribbella flavida DSM 17836]
MTEPAAPPPQPQPEPQSQLQPQSQPQPVPVTEREGDRLHPLTPFVKGWGYFVVAALAMVNNEGLRSNLRIAGFALLGVLVGGIALGALSWWFTKWQLTEDAVRVDSGFLFRRTRIIRFDRIQAIDVAQPFVARLFNMAELRMDVAGGSRSDGKLSYFTSEDAAKLRGTLLVRAKGREAAEETLQAPEQESPPLLVVPTGRLLGATLLSSTVLGSLAGLIWLIVATTVFEFHVGLFAGLPLLLGVVQPIWKQVVGNHQFTLHETRDGLRTKRGLFDLQRQTVPPGRVQGLLITEPLIWRRLNWSRVDLDIAGVVGGVSGDGEEEQNGVQLLPVGTRTEVAGVLARVLPGFDLAQIELHRAPRRARWLRPIGWRYLAYGADDQVLVTQRGWVSRKTSVVLHHKTQSVRVQQGPLQRRLRLANVHVDTPQGPTDAIALHRDPADAANLLEAQTTRAREARRTTSAPLPVQTQPNAPSPAESSSSAASPADDSSAM